MCHRDGTRGLLPPNALRWISANCFCDSHEKNTAGEVSIRARLQEQMTSCIKNTCKCALKSIFHAQPADRRCLFQCNTAQTCPFLTPQQAPAPIQTIKHCSLLYISSTSSWDPTFNTVLWGHSWERRHNSMLLLKWVFPPFPCHFPFPNITTTHKIKESIQIETNSTLNLYIYQYLSPWVFSWVSSLVPAQ